MTIKIEQNIISRFPSDQSSGKCVKNNMLKFLRDCANNKKNIYILPKKEKGEISQF